MTRKLVSIVIPAYNEEECLEQLFKRLQKVFTSEKAKYDFEVVIVENGSYDKTWDIIKEINSLDKRFKSVRLSRNFQMDGGLTAGLEFVTGDACILMTADLQDPPECISLFLREWENGWENVYGIVTKRNGTSIIRRLNSVLFYYIAGKLTDGRIPRNASDFRLVDRKVYESVRLMNERNRFVRGLFAWSGYKSKGIEIERPPRFGGVSKAHTLKVLDLAFKGIFAHSYKPLKIITLIGLLLSGVSLLLIIPLTWIWIQGGVPFAGFGTIIALILLLNSFLYLILGILGEYLGLIYEEVKQRPNFLVAELLGIEKPDKKV
jgi:polyisoprenyl-phosphate glycosyltransferase